jgi:hypothetical protein
MIGNGVLITTVINGTHTFGFELDDKKKLIDIQMKQECAEGGLVAVDPLRLLCDCAQLAAPLDLRHALLAIAAALRRDQALQQDLRASAINKLCLLQRDRSDPCRIDVTFRNGISASLKIHDCYPNVSLYLPSSHTLLCGAIKLHLPFIGPRSRVDWEDDAILFSCAVFVVVSYRGATLASMHSSILP